MGSFVVKCHPDQDRYVYWSDTVEAPHCHGDRWKVAQYLLTYELHGDRPATEARMARADANGTSAFNPIFFGWEDESFIVEQRGLLPRAKLWEFCEAYFLTGSWGRDAWLDMLEPFDACFEHESPTGNTCPVLPCPDHVVRRG